MRVLRRWWEWRPILFSLIIDNFCVKYFGKRHAHHLRKKNWKGDLYAGINLKWDYTQRTCRLTTNDYIADLCLKCNHPDPKKRQFSLYKHTPIIYGAKIKYTTKPPLSPALNVKGIFRVQFIVGALLYYARAVDKKLLFGINKLGQQQSSATKDTAADLLQLLDYIVTYPNNVILFHASGMVLAGHSDAAYLIVSKARSRAGAHIMISEDTLIPTSNDPFLNVTQIIKFVMSSASEAKIYGLFICAKAMVPLRNTLIKMSWPQPKYPIQCDKSTSVGVANHTIIQGKTKTMKMQYHWIRCHEAQGQLRFFWDLGSDNLANYSTKNHLPLYHEAHRHTHVG